MSYCLLIPHYNHAEQLSAFLPKLMAQGLDCLIVDDGSDAATLAALKEIASQQPGVHLISHGVNRGKGAAVISGCYHARVLGFSHVIQIDADGQHNPEDIPRFVSHSQQRPQSFICGNPVFDESIPKVRLYGRKVTDFWVILETFSLAIRDGMCGFRVYPLSEVERVLDKHFIGPRMDFDTEFLVKAAWEKIDLHFIDTHVVYPAVGVTHFHYLRDNLNLIRLHTRLMLGMLWRSPVLLLRLLARLAR